MAGPELQTVDAQARITLPAAFAESTVIVETVGPSEVRVRKVAEGVDPGAGTDDLMKLAEVSGAFDFWNDPAEDIYGPGVLQRRELIKPNKSCTPRGGFGGS